MDAFGPSYIDVLVSANGLFGVLGNKSDTELFIALALISIASWTIVVTSTIAKFFARRVYLRSPRRKG